MLYDSSVGCAYETLCRRGTCCEMRCPLEMGEMCKMPCGRRKRRKKGKKRRSGGAEHKNKKPTQRCGEKHRG